MVNLHCFGPTRTRVECRGKMKVAMPPRAFSQPRSRTHRYLPSVHENKTSCRESISIPINPASIVVCYCCTKQDFPAQKEGRQFSSLVNYKHFKLRHHLLTSNHLKWLTTMHVHWPARSGRLVMGVHRAHVSLLCSACSIHNYRARHFDHSSRHNDNKYTAIDEDWWEGTIAFIKSATNTSGSHTFSVRQRFVTVQAAALKVPTTKKRLL